MTSFGRGQETHGRRREENSWRKKGQETQEGKNVMKFYGGRKLEGPMPRYNFNCQLPHNKKILLK